MKWLETWACWPISISLSKTENSHLWNGFPHDPLTLRGFCHCLLWRSGHCLTFSAVWMFSVETEPLSSSALGQLLPSPTIFHTCGWLSICHMCSQFLQELETDFYPASAREQTNSLCLTQYGVHSCPPAQGPGDSEPVKASPQHTVTPKPVPSPFHKQTFCMWELLWIGFWSLYHKRAHLDDLWYSSMVSMFCGHTLDCFQFAKFLFACSISDDLL